MSERDMEWIAAWPGARANDPLRRHSQYGIGGPADWYVPVDDMTTLPDLVARAASMHIPVSVLGAGSNTLILDGGVRGIVVEFTDRTMRELAADVIELSAGCMLPRVALDCARAGIAGMEFGIGVPGTCGASVRGNAGAFGSSINDVMIDCDVVDGSGRVTTLAAGDCEFGYRTSVFKTSRRDAIVMRARFRVTRDDPSAVRERTDAISAQRKATQPYGIRSLGSVFTNPLPDHAGRLIEACGLKGSRRGGAEISPKHANFIVNVDHASARDVLDLVALAHDTVLSRFGVDLEREIAILGEDQPREEDGS